MTAPERLFVAAYPPAEVVALVHTVPRPDEPGVRWVPAEHWHVTLRFIGDAPVGTVQARLAAAVLPAATLRLGPVVSRLGRDSVVVPVLGAERLAAAVTAATHGLGRRADHPFNGHLTLGRLRHRAACGVTGHRLDASFTVERVVLVRSTLTSEGAHHEPVAEFATHRP